MDVHWKHIAEWADVLAKLEEMVRVEAAYDASCSNSSRPPAT
jgi:hypothetical protein